MGKFSNLQKEAEQIFNDAGIHADMFKNPAAWKSIVKDMADIILTAETWGCDATAEIYSTRKSIIAKIYLLHDMNLISTNLTQKIIVKCNKIIEIYALKSEILSELAAIKSRSDAPADAVIDMLSNIQIAAEAVKGDFITR